jgi:hypothetical protein
MNKNNPLQDLTFVETKDPAYTYTKDEDAVNSLYIQLEPTQELFEKEYIGNFIIQNEPNPLERPFPKATNGVKSERPGDNGYGVVTEHDLD